jgi:diguanylate cyclase (GGDEF)-like protein
MLRQLADQLAIAAQQAELYQQLQQANLELLHLATHDRLTGLANRRYFDTYLEQEWRRLQREQAPLSVILCDIDHFKLYNDALGHVAGDECLSKVAQAISAAVKRPADLVARYGGEEFAVILPNTDLAGAQQAVERMRRAVSESNIPHSESPVKPEITLSAGIACVYPSPNLAAAHLVAMADQALYQAKRTGRDRFCVAQ